MTIDQLIETLLALPVYQRMMEARVNDLSGSGSYEILGCSLQNCDGSFIGLEVETGIGEHDVGDY